MPVQLPHATLMMTMQELLAPGHFVDSDAPSIETLAHRVTAGLRDEIERIIRLYRAVRDTIVYDPYVDFFDQQNYRAGSVLAAVFASASRQYWPLPLGQ